MMTKTRDRLLGATALVVSPMVAAPAFAQATGGTAPDLTPISDAVNAGIAQGISVMLAIAPILVSFAVVWGVINKSRSMSKG